MSEALEAEQKTNPQGDPITSVAVPKPVEGAGRKDPHAEAKRQFGEGLTLMTLGVVETVRSGTCAETVAISVS